MADADIETLERLTASRHSCRAFKNACVPREVIERIVRVAQRSASDCNIQPWQLIIVGHESLERLRAAMYARAASDVPTVSDIPPIDRYLGVYQDRRRDCGWALYGAVGIQRGDRTASRSQALENYRFFGAPHLALITTHASLGPRALLDCGGYVAMFMLAAQACGVASVAQASIAHRADVLREHLAVPADQFIVCGISFGWEDAAHPANAFRTPRVPLEDAVTFR